MPVSGKTQLTWLAVSHSVACARRQDLNRLNFLAGWDFLCFAEPVHGFRIYERHNSLAGRV